MLKEFKKALCESINVNGNVLADLLTDYQLQFAVINKLPVDVDRKYCLDRIKKNAYRGEKATKIIDVKFDYVFGKAKVTYEWLKELATKNEGETKTIAYTDEYSIELDVLDDANALIF